MIRKIYQKSQVEIPFLYVYRDDEPGVGSEGKAFGIRRNSLGNYAPKRVYYPFVSHNDLVGLFTPDGTNEWTIDEIIKKFFVHAGKQTVGIAWKPPGAPWYGDKAHYWGPDNNGYIQEFNYGSCGRCAICSKWDSSEAFLIRAGFYDYYISHSGPWTCGWPISEEYYGNGYKWHKFQCGKLRWSASTGVQWFPY